MQFNLIFYYCSLNHLIDFVAGDGGADDRHLVGGEGRRPPPPRPLPPQAARAVEKVSQPRAVVFR